MSRSPDEPPSPHRARSPPARARRRESWGRSPLPRDGVADGGGTCLHSRRYRGAVRLVIARCSVDYVGRLTAHLPLATRLIMVKADGSVSIHADDRAYKPLNWMSPPCRLEEAPGVWRVVNKAGEELRITLEEIFHDTSHELGVDPGLVKDGVEAHLQELLAASPRPLGEGFTLVRREYPTAIGPVDLLCRDADRAARSRSRSSGAARSTASSSSPATWSC